MIKQQQIKVIGWIGVMFLVVNLLVHVFTNSNATKAAAEEAPEEVKQYDGMKLIFQDEFDGDTLDDTKWQVRPWPENGTHHYANEIGKDKNIWVEDGNLILQAKPYEGDDDFSSTSGHVTTDEKFDFRYGRVDVRAKIPTETGMWPAIWMMPTEQMYEWPMEGEIDIMELISQEPDKIWSTLHSGVDGTDTYFNEGDTLTIDDGTFYDDYHVYSLDWEPGVLRFYMDDELVTEIDDWQNWIEDDETGDIVERDFPTPFDKHFYLKLNLATGGWSQDVDDTTRWGERTSMKVDYVRVYQETHSEYQYTTDEPFATDKQGAVWYAQQGQDDEWENFTTYDSDEKLWTTEADANAYIGQDSLSANFSDEANTVALGFRAPYDGIVKVGLQDNVTLETSENVPFTITTGTMTETTSDLYRTETITPDTNDLADEQTYIPVDADDMIRFNILNSDNAVHGFDPVVTYVDDTEYDAWQKLKTEIEAVKDTDTSNYTASSVTQFETALKQAETYVNGTGDEDDYTKATTNLIDAFGALEVVTDDNNATDDENENNDDGKENNNENSEATNEESEKSNNNNDSETNNNNNSEANGNNDSENNNNNDAVSNEDNNGTASNNESNEAEHTDAMESGNANNDNNEGQPLPKTATNMHLLLLIGLLLTSLGFFAIIKHRKSKA